MKNRSSFILLLLLLNVIAVNPSINALSSDSSTVLHNTWFGADNATASETVYYYVNASDSDGIATIEFSLYLSAGSDYHEVHLGWYLMEQNGSIWQFGVYIDPYYFNTSLFVEEIVIIDSEQQETYFWLPEYFTDLPRVELYGTTPDLNPPVLEDIGFDKSLVTGGDIVSVRLNATDTQIGLGDEAYGQIYRVEDNYTSYESGEYIVDLYLQYDASLDLFTGLWEVNQYQGNGTYIIGWISMSDKLDNWISYYNSSTASNNFSSPVLTVQNELADDTPPQLNSLDFRFEAVSTFGDQSVKINVSDNLAGFNYGYIEYSYFDPEFGEYYIFGYSDFYSDSDSDNIFTASIQQYDELSPNQTIYVEYISLWDNANNNVFYQRGIGINASFELKSIDPSGSFDISITPSTGVNNVDQPVLFQIDMINNLGVGVVGKANLRIDGPSTKTILFGEYSMDNGNHQTVSKELRFSTPGEYTITAEFTLHSGQIYQAVANWTVNQDEHINVAVSPDSGKSQVNGSVEFTAIIYSTFVHDMPDVTLKVIATGSTSGAIYTENFTMSLPANSQVRQSFSITFPNIDIYTIEVTLYDDIGATWRFAFDWSVVENLDNSSAGNNSNPEIELPGFELPIVVVSLAGAVGISYRRRNSRGSSVSRQS